MIHPLLIDDFVKQALLEDMPHGHDVTSACFIHDNREATASFNAREDGAIAGLDIALRAFSLMSDDFQIETFVSDGDKVSKNDKIASVIGPASLLLTVERVALNILSHLSGVATLTHSFTREIADTSARITCTRKTLPGLRIFQKYAVTVGGGFNHRYGLDDAIMIKDNHIAISGGVEQALTQVKKYASHMKIIEIEVDTLDQLQHVLDHGGAQVVLLDNMGPDDLTKAIQMVNGALITEASGGVNIQNIRNIARTGVDFISIGMLTHSAPSLDIGFDVIIEKN